WHMYRQLPRQRAHELIDVLEFLQRLPTSITRAPVEPRREPDGKGLRKIFIRMALRIPVIEIHHITAAKRAWSVSVRGFLARSASENVPPSFLSRNLVGVVVGVRRLVPDQFQKPFFCSAFDLEHHCALK